MVSTIDHNDTGHSGIHQHVLTQVEAVRTQLNILLYAAERRSSPLQYMAADVWTRLLGAMLVLIAASLT